MTGGKVTPAALFAVTESRESHLLSLQSWMSSQTRSPKDEKNNNNTEALKS